MHENNRDDMHSMIDGGLKKINIPISSYDCEKKLLDHLAAIGASAAINVLEQNKQQGLTK
jgi:hypothetical protein